ncbi:hypothetical protein LP421_06650 [Rhizobium sp. RCAM05350]|nr:hypothetical protein LP421_06650 [Rhizobium sp. RCAM05350]
MEIFLTWLTSAGGIFGLLITAIKNVLGLEPLALLFALLPPSLLLYGRHEVRLRRLRSIKDFLISFGTDQERSRTDNGAEDIPDAEGNAATPGIADPVPLPADAAKPSPNVRLTNNPSFEFVKSKYISDLQVQDPTDGKTFNEMNDIEQIDWIIKSIGRFGSSSDWKIFLSSIGFILLCYFGFSALFGILSCGLGSDTCNCAQPDAAAACPGTTGGYGNWQQLTVIGLLAFAGAFIAAIRNFVRSVAVFDLSPYTFLRHTAEIVASVIFTIILFAVFHDPISQITGLVANILPAAAESVAPAGTPPAAAATGDHIQAIWFGLAPLLGLLPQSATKFLLIKFQNLINWIKTTDDRFINVTKIVSLDIVDGIDYETRFRLEECGIYDVQNLATYNPIMLHIESPYGIYQVIDWVAQAQLCHILGPEKFLIFRELNIRTIFDLERAINSRYSVKAFDEICAGVLWPRQAACARRCGSVPPNPSPWTRTRRKPSTPTPIASGRARECNVTMIPSQPNMCCDGLPTICMSAASAASGSTFPQALGLRQRACRTASMRTTSFRPRPSFRPWASERQDENGACKRRFHYR